MRGVRGPREIFKEVVLTKHRLMLSAAAAALLAAPASVHADTTITTSTSTALETASAGTIVIDGGGGIGISTAGSAVTINSNNAVTNNGFIANTGSSDATGLQINTSPGNLLPGSTGFVSTGTIDLGGGGTGKRGIWITGGKTFYGPVTLTSLTVSGAGVTTTASQSSLILKGDNSVAFLLDQGTTVTSNILLGGGGIIQNASDNSTASNSAMVFLDGTVNGNVINAGGLSGTGPGMIGLQINGGIHSCASDTGAPSGFTCPSSFSGGSLVNSGQISVGGTGLPSTRGGNPQSASALVIASSIDGGVLNAGPGTSSNITPAVISSNGIATSTGINPTVLIDPSRSISGTATTPRGPVILGPVTADVDAIDPGYSFINRGSIVAQPLDAQLSTVAMVIQGSSAAYFTCLGTSVSATACDTTPHSVTQTVNGANVTVNNAGGFLNTGEITATTITNVTNRTNGTISATALYIGAFATVPRLDVMAQTVGGTTTTTGSISAEVSGVGQGNALALSIGQNANVPVINVGRGATISASVLTNTTTPTQDIANTNMPFSLASQAITDQSGTVKLINNAGTIKASNTTLTPATGTVVSNIQRAVDLSSSTTGGITINNSGVLLGDVLFSSAGNGNVLNVGNIGASGTANPGTGAINSPSNYAVVGTAFTSQPIGGAPSATATLLNFGSGTGHRLHVGGYGYVNADIRSGVGALDVQVDPNGLLFIANTASSLQANNFNAAQNATVGLSISQANLNSLTPVVQANAANLSGANLALQFGTFISSGFTAESVAAPTAQTVTLIRAPSITDTTLAEQNAILGQNTPFLFETPAESGLVPLAIGDSGGQQTLLLRLLPRSVNEFNADGSPGLNLKGDARNQFPFVAQALSTDTELGAAVATAMTVYNTPGQASSGINVAASQQQAEQVFSQFAPDVSGGVREIAIMLTDQATGPVAARQRLLRSYGKVPGEMTLWAEEFTGQINNKGRVGGAGTLTSYKDHGFGFSLGLDAGSPRNGWYGGAFTFYTGDVTQQLPRDTRTNTQWYMLTGYSHWQGKKVFFDSQFSAAYGQFNQTRGLNVSGVVRLAESKRAAAMGALGFKGGVMTNLAGFKLDPFVSLDGMTLREEGFTETGGGPGLNLQVAPYFANSLRAALGADIKKTVSVWDIDLTPEGRVGYRYELLQQPVKVKAAFESTGGLAQTGNTLTFVGPDPDKGNYFLGASLNAGTDTWHLGIHYDWVRGSNGSTTQVGTVTVLGRI
jgi:hypothetical protein